MIYENFDYSDKEKVLELLSSLNYQSRCEAIIGMVNGIPDQAWVLDRLLVLVNDENFWVAKTAINSLGDLARMYGELDLERVNCVLDQIIRKELEQEISETREDFDLFL